MIEEQASADDEGAAVAAISCQLCKRVVGSATGGVQGWLVTFEAALNESVGGCRHLRLLLSAPGTAAAWPTKSLKGLSGPSKEL